MTTIQGKTPEEIMEEFIGIENDALNQKWLRSSMKSLLEYVEESLPDEQSIDVPYGDMAKTAIASRNRGIADCKEKVREIKNSI